MRQLPVGWARASIGEINRYQTKFINPSQFPNEKFELYSVPSYADQQPEIVLGANVKSSKFVVEENDVLLCKINPRLNRVWKVHKKGKYRQIASSEWVVIRQRALVSSYIRYALSEKGFRDLLVSEVSGIGGSLTRAQPQKIFKYEINIPPYNEQLRIVSILDEIGEYTSSSLECLERVEQTIKSLRSSILRDATTGKLLKYDLFEAANNEQVNYPIPSSWKWQKFSTIAKVSSNLVDPSDFKSLPHIAPNHIESKTGRLLPYTTVEADGVKSVKHRFKEGQILYSKIRPNLAKATIVDFEGLCSADMYPIDTEINTRYLLLWLLSDEFTHQVSQIQGRTVLPKINMKELGEILVPVPPIKEQMLLAEKAHFILNLANYIEEKCSSVKFKIEEAVQLSLSKAVSGELVTQDLTAEGANNLLARIAKIDTLFEERQDTIPKIEKTNFLELNVEGTMIKKISMSKASVLEEIKNLEGDSFSFSDIEKKIGGDYEVLKNILFEILDEPKLGVKQIYSEKLKEVRFTRDLL